MGRGHYHPKSCRVCGRSEPEVSNISQTGRCPEHGAEPMNDNFDQLKAHSGPHFNHWRQRLAASVGAMMPDTPG